MNKRIKNTINNIKNILWICTILTLGGTGCGLPPSPVVANSGPTTSPIPTNTQTDTTNTVQQPIEKQWRFQLADKSDNDDDDGSSNNSENSESTGPFIHPKSEGQSPPNAADAVAKYLSDYQLHHVRGDGSCEVRAQTLRLLVYFAIEKHRQFNDFIKTLEKSAAQYAKQDERFAKKSNWKNAVARMKEFDHFSFKGTIDMFNDESFEEVVVEQFIRHFWSASIRNSIVVSFIEQIKSVRKIANFLQEPSIVQQLDQMQQFVQDNIAEFINNSNNLINLNKELTKQEQAIKKAHDAKDHLTVTNLEEVLSSHKEVRKFNIKQHKPTKEIEKPKNWGFKAIAMNAIFNHIFDLPLPQDSKDGLVIPFSQPGKKHMDVLIHKHAWSQ
ncbi:MAG: hypothetical protein AAF310_02145 [Myxococcota bacterium]